MTQNEQGRFGIILLSESSPRRSVGVDNRRFPASDDVWLSSASELRIRSTVSQDIASRTAPAPFRTPVI
jgi:hypothetical protein